MLHVLVLGTDRSQKCTYRVRVRVGPDCKSIILYSIILIEIPNGIWDSVVITALT